MDTEIEILMGDAEDIPKVMEIAESLPDYYDEWALHALPEDMEQYPFLVARHEGEIVGFACVSVLKPLVAELIWMAVLPKARRHGVGRKLIEFLSDSLSEDGEKLLMTKTLGEKSEASQYEATRRFFESMGFLHVETIDPYPGNHPGTPCAIYIKPL